MSVVLPQLGSIWIYRAHVTTKGHVDAHGVRLQPVAILVSPICDAIGAIADLSGLFPEGLRVNWECLQLRVMSGLGSRCCCCLY